MIEIYQLTNKGSILTLFFSSLEFQNEYIQRERHVRNTKKDIILHFFTFNIMVVLREGCLFFLFWKGKLNILRDVVLLKHLREKKNVYQE